MGNPICRTPTLNRLARRGVVFDNAYTPSPVCVPARQSIALGKYPLHTGCERFGEDIPPGSRTFARVFAEAGWLTVACGSSTIAGPTRCRAGSSASARNAPCNGRTPTARKGASKSGA